MPFSEDVDAFILDLRNHSARLSVSLAALSDVLCSSLESGGKILVCGNGGSASDAEHIAAELVGGLTSHSRRALPCLALTADSAVVTAVANDYGYDFVFARQVEALAFPRDVLWLISTSGRSVNLLQATKSAAKVGVTTVAMCPAGSDLGRVVDLCVDTHTSNPQMTQALQRLCYHWVCEQIERSLTTQDADKGNSNGE